MLRVVRVNTWSRFQSFLGLPREVYRHDPNWVPHLNLQTLLLLGSPFDRNKRFLLALDGDRPVARLAAKIHEHGGNRALHFGFFECLEGYPEAVPMLVDEAHLLAPELPMRGPYHFTMEDPYTGLLIEGFEHEPCFWASYNPPHYAAYLEQSGLGKVMDLWTYCWDWERTRLRPISRRAEKAAEKGVTVRSLDTRNRLKEIRQVANAMNYALAENWGFEDFTKEQVWELYFLSYLFLDPKWLLMAQYQEQTVGACIILPDYNPWIKESGGRLTPSLVKKLFFRKSEIRRMRAWGLGVLPEHRSLLTAPALMNHAVELGKSSGVHSGDVSWILESNTPMNSMLRAVGAYRYKTHRVLERPAIQ
jgi:ribosomal protein S18 acetylase RimI-like enzyme